jgi:hypothetical protein
MLLDPTVYNAESVNLSLRRNLRGLTEHEEKDLDYKHIHTRKRYSVVRAAFLHTLGIIIFAICNTRLRHFG